jgi:hypothetical protein
MKPKRRAPRVNPMEPARPFGIESQLLAEQCRPKPRGVTGAFYSWSPVAVPMKLLGSIMLGAWFSDGS